MAVVRFVLTTEQTGIVQHFRFELFLDLALFLVKPIVSILTLEPPVYRERALR